jgi:hypothetical protein
MKLTKIGILALQGSSSLRQRIADLEGKTIQTVNRWIRECDDNLTKAGPLSLIKQETGLTDEHLLEEAVAEAK